MRARYWAADEAAVVPVGENEGGLFLAGGVGGTPGDAQKQPGILPPH
jgi:hypothetical protein